MSIYEEFHARRNEGNRAVLSENNLVFKRFYNLDTRTYEPGELSAKTKELLGLTASAVLRCNDCIYYHIERAKEEGCTRGEINEALAVALTVGGSIVIPHLRAAETALDELFGKRDVPESEIG